MYLGTQDKYMLPSSATIPVSDSQVFGFVASVKSTFVGAMELIPRKDVPMYQNDTVSSCMNIYYKSTLPIHATHMYVVVSIMLALNNTPEG